MTPDPSLSILVIARDAARDLPALVAALGPLRLQIPQTELVVLVDDRTQDNTEAIAAEAGARVRRATFRGFGAFKEQGRRLCLGRWVLNLDVDERPSAEAITSIVSIVRGPCAYAWTLDIRTTLGGRATRRGPFAAERRLRLFPRQLGHWSSEDLVHESPRVSLPIRAASGVVQHESFADVWDCLERHARYGIRAARTRSGPPARLKGWTRACLRAARHLIVHGGLIAGPPGIVLAYGQARATWLKWTSLPADEGAGAPR